MAFFLRAHTHHALHREVSFPGLRAQGQAPASGLCPSPSLNLTAPPMEPQLLAFLAANQSLLENLWGLVQNEKSRTKKVISPSQGLPP
jgi:hypothetical protein